ncbi:ABC transporter permease [Ruegeria marina]|uniref:Peptide/nickel transport system permease protein n=1 Tax=Ruegeria marina TaxID=639004 RepID=A0A1G7DZY9_9RHOB|nr:ABC transporter permease [Ruegeria marina]SDE57038.1 peptide/nickel transport system permease protein [Ruegeria marina]
MTTAAISPGSQTLRRMLANPSVIIGGLLVLAILLMGLLAPVLGTRDPADISPKDRNQPPGYETTVRDNSGAKVPVVYRLGSDTLGRDVYSRIVYGARISLVVGISVAAISIVIGMAIGVLAGYVRWLDGIIMRIMDGLMAIPAILLAIAVVSLFSAGLTSVIIAIVVPEVPRVVRLVRSIVLSIREEPYVEAAITAGTRTPVLLVRHILPNTIAPLIVQGTFIVASAIIVEAILSFLGIGIPPEIPTWGNIMAEGRAVFQLYPHNIFYPGLVLALTVLAVNMLGDGLRDTLDPRFAKRV